MSKKILIVDDEKDILELLDYHLIKEGYKTWKPQMEKKLSKLQRLFARSCFIRFNDARNGWYRNMYRI